MKGQAMTSGTTGWTKSLMLVIGACLLGLAPAAHAALAPNHQRIAELKAILDHPQVVAAFAVSDPIVRIEYRAADRYLVVTAKCQLPVRIVGRQQPGGMVGPRQFDVVPDVVQCPRR